MALIVPGVVQFTLLGTLNGRPCDNIVAIDIDTDILESRNEAIKDQAAALNHAFYGNIAQYVSTAYTFHGCRYLDLNSADGIVGGSTDLQALGQAPQNGTSPGEAMPGNVPLLIPRPKRALPNAG